MINLPKKDKAPSTVLLNNRPVTQEEFDDIYKGYKDYAIAKNTYKKFRTSILVALKDFPQFSDQIIKSLLNIKES